MQYLYIDESGSMTVEYSNNFPFFVISIVHVFDKNRLKKALKRFVSKNLQKLKECDKDNKMFKDGKFLELKGSSLSRELKLLLANYFFSNELFEVFYIVVENNKVHEKLYSNKARAFNYLLDLFMLHNLKQLRLPYDEYFIQIDERNIKTDAKKSLEDYLNTSLVLANELTDNIVVSYQDSCNNSLIQLSDFFANLFFSFLMNNESYMDTINNLQKKKIIRHIFNFPLTKN